MCVASSLTGVLLFLRRQSLLTESLSHAAYPGMAFAVLLTAFFFPEGDSWAFIPLFCGAVLAAYLALVCVRWLQKRGVKSDAALCFVLAFFFGAGVFLASGLQGEFPRWHQAMDQFLFGQAATLRDLHVILYGGLSLLIVFFLRFFYHPLQAIFFDRTYAESQGISVSVLERIFWGLLLVSLIVGMRSVGVVLMSAMAVAPAVAARQWSDQLHRVLILAGVFGALSGLLGVVLSVELSIALSNPENKISLPTGPMIVLVSGGWAFISLMIAPKRGLLFRFARLVRFRLRCTEENLLKTAWKGAKTKEELFKVHKNTFLPFLLLRLRKQGWLKKEKGIYQLTEDGKERANQIIRFHRLWELYLTETLGRRAAEVHESAEEMEHIMTFDLEKRLTKLLANPTKDPHAQPIPERRR